MQHNDQQSTLLIWLNQQATFHSQTPLTSLTSFPSSALTHILFTLIDRHFFSSMLQTPYNHQLWLSKIQQYLLQQHDFKMKKGYKSELAEKEQMADLVRLMLFVLMRQDTKGQLVAGVLQLGEDVQISLMQQLKKVQGQLQNNTEIQQIYLKIQQLQDQNIALKDKLAQMEHQNLKINQVRQQILTENEQLSQEHKKMTNEKTNIMEKMGVSQFKDYVSLYRELQAERAQLIEQQREVENNNRQLEDTNYTMEEKIEEDRTIVQHLKHQISKYKQALQSIKGQENRPSFSKSKQNKQNHLSLPHFPNVKMIRSIEQDTTFNSFAHSISSQPEDDILTQSIKEYNEGMQHKLEELQGTIGMLNSQIGKLRQAKRKTAREVRRKEKIIELVQREIGEFRLNYEYTIYG